MDCDDSLRALIGYDRELDAAVLNVKNGFSHISLREDGFIPSIFRYRTSAVHTREKNINVEAVALWFVHLNASATVSRSSISRGKVKASASAETPALCETGPQGFYHRRLKLARLPTWSFPKYANDSMSFDIICS
jgi:hypothetical protein